VQDETGAVLYALAAIEDLSEQKKLEEELEQARAELEERAERRVMGRNPYGLTLRELTVLHKIASGKADKEIAAELMISPYTAQKHVANILAKMTGSSRTEAAVRAVREGLLG
jgi:DNA-binding NarL/FixJ family response regulator